MRLLRIAGFVKSVRGQSGGYTLASPAAMIVIGDVLESLGGKLFGDRFCERHAGLEVVCVHNTDCSMRALWLSLQHMLEKVLFHTTLADLLQNESGMQEILETRHEALILPTPMQNKAASA